VDVWVFRYDLTGKELNLCWGLDRDGWGLVAAQSYVCCVGRATGTVGGLSRMQDGRHMISSECSYALVVLVHFGTCKHQGVHVQLMYMRCWDALWLTVSREAFCFGLC
jgi:hypothetical protein